MRIAFIANHGSVHSRRWAGFFAESGHEVHVITCGSGTEPRGADYDVHDVGTPRPGKAGYVLRVPAVRRAVNRIRPDVVHANYATSYGLLGLTSGKRPLVVSAWGSDLLISAQNPVLRVIVRRVLRAAALVTVPSDEMQGVAEDLTGGSVPIEIVQFGVESERLASLAQHARAEAPETMPTRIVSARPLQRLYRTDVLLDGLVALKEQPREWECLIFGDGPERRALERQAAGLGFAEHVSFLGQQPPEEVESSLAAATIYASFAESDGSSVALLEAMALGAVPVVSATRPNRAWITDGKNGVTSDIDAVSARTAFSRALLLDQPSVARANQAIVAERADRARNMELVEARLQDIVASSA